MFSLSRSTEAPEESLPSTAAEPTSTIVSITSITTVPTENGLR